MSFSVRWGYSSEAHHYIYLSHKLTGVSLKLYFRTSGSFSPSTAIKVSQSAPGRNLPHDYGDPILVYENHPIDYNFSGVRVVGDTDTSYYLTISSDDYNVIHFSGTFFVEPPSFVHSDSRITSVDMSQYLKSSEVEILKTRLLALKTEFARLESKWSRLEQFTTDLENFNRVLDGYKNTIPPESYSKLSSVVDKLKAALK